MKTYRVRTGCEIAGRWRDAGEEIPLSADEARELAPPFGNVVSAVEEKGKADAKLNRRQRRNRRAPV
ncbi:hypothetical protein [Agrobacterium larrymoorei]|uniref:Uncharacterized protein n=1 Tax=Agrobacterium larrymoorei TaxID=160699 RepID=A0AAF0HA68_9HYPH|nr:hypothetical protein [Agrobacterium larrymoorei]WHA40920.1 hypothetical protein CFBP5477_014080 [Agrobacterium larrymoorei]